MAYRIDEQPRREGSFSEDGSHRYTREFVLRHSAIVDAANIMRLTGVPKWGDYYLPTDLSARCVGVHPRMDQEHPYVWRIRCDYSSKYPQPGQENEDPLLRPAKIRWSSVRVTRTQAKDVNGKPFENLGIGEPFQSPPPVVRTQGRLVITRNEPSFNPQLPLTYGNTLNSSKWYGYAKGQVLCEEITGENAWEFGIEYAVVTYSFLVDRKGHDVEVLNVGTKYKTSSGKIEPCHVNGVLTTIPQKLDAQGHLLAEGADPVYVKFVVFEDENFANLNL